MSSYNIHLKATLFPAFARGRGGFLVGKAVIVLDVCSSCVLPTVGGSYHKARSDFPNRRELCSLQGRSLMPLIHRKCLTE